MYLNSNIFRPGGPGESFLRFVVRAVDCPSLTYCIKKFFFILVIVPPATVAKNSSLLSSDLTLIILHIALRNLRVLGSIGPRTSIHIGKNSIEGRAFPYFFHFLVRCPGRGQTASFTCQVYISFGKGARDRNIPRQTSTGFLSIIMRQHFIASNILIREIQEATFIIVIVVAIEPLNSYAWVYE
ncbi:hypothetical protein HELRODRAFT_168375 [Helobdella robusta]|uniref:Uncharacterized protein n=1 Tax=Helobdella robusta TaxID=6412 RepID=T1F0I2_HELRO|nr:hypothetical protein HELRODRAFT_168375 [Helobdella robusta]ESO09393.1 hypothetical protein HELRODRAFT_168375 [Helobdella robusta]